MQFVDPKQHIDIRSGKLPHWFQEGRMQFISFRLADSLPQTAIDELKEARQQWLAAHPEPWDEQTDKEYRVSTGQKVEKWIDRGHGSCIMVRPEVRALVTEALEFYDGSRYALHAYVVMPNHVHLLMTPADGHPPAKTIGSVKRFTACAINKALGTTGAVWQREMFDRLVRSEDDFIHYVQYIKANPAHLPQGSYSLYVDSSIDRG